MLSLIMKQYSIDYWNKKEKPSEEVNAFAIPGDYVVEIGGILYLVQRKNFSNNIVCFRIEDSDMTVLSSFLILRKWLIANDILFITVEGRKKRYNFLKKIADEYGFSVMHDLDFTDRNVFYIKLM